MSTPTGTFLLRDIKVFRDFAELLQGSFQIIDDFAGDDVGGREVGAVFERFVL